MKKVSLFFVGLISSVALAQQTVPVKIVNGLDDYEIKNAVATEDGAALEAWVDVLGSGSVWVHEPIAQFEFERRSAGSQAIQSKTPGWELKAEVSFADGSWTIFANELIPRSR